MLFTFSGYVKLNETRLTSLTTFIKSLELNDNMEIIRLPKKKHSRRKSLTPLPSPNLDFTLSEENCSIYSSSDEESRMIDFPKSCNKRRNDTSTEVQEPLNKRIRFDEYHCGRCDFVCYDNEEIHNHFENCLLSQNRRSDLTPVPSFSSDFSDQ